MFFIWGLTLSQCLCDAKNHLKFTLELHHRRRIRQKRRQRSSLLVGGTELIQFDAEYRISTRMIGRKRWKEEWTLGGMDASEKLMIIWFTPHQITSLTKRMFLQKPFFKSSLLLSGWCGIQVRPPNSSDDLCLLLCLILLLSMWSTWCTERIPERWPVGGWGWSACPSCSSAASTSGRLAGTVAALLANQQLMERFLVSKTWTTWQSLCNINSILFIDHNRANLWSSACNKN